MCAGGGTHTGWWTLVASRRVMACRLPCRLRDLLEPWSLVSQGVSLEPRDPGMVQMLCLCMAARTRRAACWCHDQCSPFNSSGLYVPIWAMSRVAT